MGSIWLRDLPDVIASAGLDVITYSGWENRSRSSGGYDALLGIGIHHDASGSNSSDQANEDYCWSNADDRPIGAVRLRRSGVVVVGAAGATNTMGKGGPLTTSRGTIPLDAGNKYMIAIEAANNGTGETWPAVMIDAYIRILAVLCQAYGFDASRDIFTHNSYCAPSCPNRKVDPAGPTPSLPAIGGTSGCKVWEHNDVRNAVLDCIGGNQTPPPTEDDEVTDDDIERIAKRSAQLVWDHILRDPTVNKDVKARDLLGYTRGASANADRQTRPDDPLNFIAEEVWKYSKRELTG